MSLVGQSPQGGFSLSAGQGPPRSESRPNSNVLAKGSCASASVTEECDHENQENATQTIRKRVPWNKGKLTGAKPPLRPKHVWSIRTKLQIEGRVRDLAMFNLAIDSKLRGCDVVAVKVRRCRRGGYTADRATVRQKKTFPARPSSPRARHAVARLKVRQRDRYSSVPASS